MGGGWGVGRQTSNAQQGEGCIQCRHTLLTWLWCKSPNQNTLWVLLFLVGGGGSGGGHQFHIDRWEAVRQGGCKGFRDKLKMPSSAQVVFNAILLYLSCLGTLSKHIFCCCQYYIARCKAVRGEVKWGRDKLQMYESRGQLLSTDVQGGKKFTFVRRTPLRPPTSVLVWMTPSRINHFFHVFPSCSSISIMGEWVLVGVGCQRVSMSMLVLSMSLT